jgi:hypothetical protein
MNRRAIEEKIKNLKSPILMDGHSYFFVPILDGKLFNKILRTSLRDERLNCMLGLRYLTMLLLPSRPTAFVPISFI